MLEQYITVEKTATEEIIEKKSRFIAYVSPISNEQEALAIIQDIKKQHYNAAHNVFAFRVGLERELKRYSDDGEPSGTAGMPILNLLSGENVINAVIVVTRYFGGTLLGTGGLVKAYGKAAKQALLSAGIVERVYLDRFVLETDYSFAEKIKYELINMGHKVLNVEYDNKVRIHVLVKHNLRDSFNKSIIDLSNGTIQPTFISSEYY